MLVRVRRVGQRALEEGRIEEPMREPLLQVGGAGMLHVATAQG
jgi:hypothetical protein